jgi:hypothetical protein
MLHQVIFMKEWRKLRWVLLALLVSVVGAVLWFWLRLDYSYSTIEPESMMWYRFAQLGDKPYALLAPLFPLAAIVIALSQFLPEAVHNRVRILTHLPLPLPRMVRLHLSVGIAAYTSISLLLTLALLLVMQRYYPPPIVLVTLKDCLAWMLLGVILYLGFAAAVIERKLWYKGIKLLVPILVVLFFWVERYTKFDLLLVLVALGLILPVYDSFLSVKNLRIKRFTNYAGVCLLGILLLIQGTARYQEDFAKELQHYYIFYSPLLNDFVFQHNAGGHQFEYGTTQRNFDRLTYEESLPFVYWKNLDIQGRLPVTVNNQSYDKNSIRTARLSLQYHPDWLQNAEVPLYPLFNSQSDKGVISFPETILAVDDDQLTVYDCETVAVDQPLTQELNLALQNAEVQFPLNGLWGKTTNMKPFDWGYFIRDSQQRLFNLRRTDNIISVTAVKLPHNLAPLVHLQVSENRQQNFYGYAITADNHVYLIGFPDYHFIELTLKNFDYQTMRFHLIADPLHYLVRYDNGQDYHAVLFNRNYQFIRNVTFNEADMLLR